MAQKTLEMTMAELERLKLIGKALDHHQLFECGVMPLHQSIQQCVFGPVAPVGEHMARVGIPCRLHGAILCKIVI